MEETNFQAKSRSHYVLNSPISINFREDKNNTFGEKNQQ